MEGINSTQCQGLMYRYNNKDCGIGKNWPIRQWNKIKNPEKDSHKHTQLIFDKVVKKFNGGKPIFSQMVMKQLGFHGQKQTKPKLPKSYAFNSDNITHMITIT